MSLRSGLSVTLRSVLRPALDWPVAAQQEARRNAMLAATQLAQRRAEREEVAEFLARRSPEPARGSAGPVPAPRTAHG